MPSQASVERRRVGTRGCPRRLVAEPGPQLHELELIHLGEGLAWIDAEAELHGQRKVRQPLPLKGLAGPAQQDPSCPPPVPEHGSTADPRSLVSSVGQPRYLTVITLLVHGK